MQMIKDIEANNETEKKIDTLHFLAGTLFLPFSVTDIRRVNNRLYRADRPCFARQELGVDEGDDTTLGYDHVTKKFVQSVTNGDIGERKFYLNGGRHILLVISDGKLEVARDNTLFLNNFECHDEYRCPSNRPCYHGQHFQQAQESQQQGTPGLPQGTLTKYTNY